MTQRHHIKVKIAAGQDPRNVVVSGKVKHSNKLQQQCESILAVYESGKQAQARKEFQALKTKHPDATLVKQLQALILYHDCHHPGNFRFQKRHRYC
jgi:malonyl CoA-acyl carrier protein transacylase